MEDRELPRGVATADRGPVEVHFDGACEPARGGGIAAYGFTVEGPGLRHEEYGLAVPPHHPRATNNVAEYVAAIRALEWLRGVGYTGAVVAKGDSQLVIRQMSGEYRVRTPHLRPYHERLGQLASGFVSLRFVWIPRESNQEADRLSKRAIQDAGGYAPPGRAPAGEAEKLQPLDSNGSGEPEE